MTDSVQQTAKVAVRFQLILLIGKLMTGEQTITTIEEKL
jgi:hypothetical protein